MRCPSCGTVYDRREFERGETYFECDSCSTELQLSSEEQLDEHVRHGHGANSLEAVAPRTVAQFPEPPDRNRQSTGPLKVGVGILAVFGLIGVFVCLGEIARGNVVGGVVGVAVYVGLFGTPIVGIVRRRRFGLYMAYVVLGFLLLSALMGLLRGGYRSGAEFIGAVAASCLFAGTAVWLLTWFVRNRDLFGQQVRQPELVDDIYSPPESRCDDSRMGAAEPAQPVCPPSSGGVPPRL